MKKRFFGVLIILLLLLYGCSVQEANIVDFAIPEDTREVIILSRPGEE